MEKEVDLQKLCKKEMFWGTKNFPYGCKIYMSSRTKLNILGGDNSCYGSEIVVDDTMRDFVIRFSDEEEKEG